MAEGYFAGQPTDSRPTPARFLLDCARRQRHALGWGSALMLGASVTSLVYPWLAGNIASVLLKSPKLSLSLSASFGWLAALLAVQSGLALANHWIVSRIYARAAFDLRTRLFNHLQWLGLESHALRSRSEALTLIERDAESIAGFISTTLVGILPACVTLLGAAGMLLYLQPLYGSIAVLAIPVYVVLLRLVRRRLSQLSRRFAGVRADCNRVADEQLAMLPVVKAFGREKDMSQRFFEHETRLFELGKRLYFAAGSLGPLSQLLAALGTVVLLWALSGKVLDGSLLAADFLVFFMYAFVFTRPLSSMAGVYGAVHRTWGSTTRIVETLALPTESQAGEALASFERAIVFENVDFAYAGRPAVVEELSLELRRDQVTVVLGPNGAGKSTLLKLLLRFVAPSRGRIHIDGRDFASIAPSSLRRLMAVVPQEMLLLSGSIYDNIALGAANATREQVVKAAKLAHADEFIQQLPSGYGTVVGEAGVLLSGGQRQRIALARALLKDAPILLLDEATAMLDAATEAAFFETCRQAFRHRTVVIVSHHLTDLAFADQVVRIERGQEVRLGVAG